MSFCSNCGKPLNDNKKFCIHCGYQITQVSTPPPIKQPPMNSCLLTMEAGRQKGISYLYDYILFYADRVIIVSVNQKEMEKDIYKALKILKKQQKMSLKEQTNYRYTHTANFIEHLKKQTDQTLISSYKQVTVLPIHLIQRAICQFQHKKSYVGANDVSTTTTRGYIELNCNGINYKYAHGYSYSQDAQNILGNLFGSRIKVYY